MLARAYEQQQQRPLHYLRSFGQWQEKGLRLPLLHIQVILDQEKGLRLPLLHIQVRLDQGLNQASASDHQLIQMSTPVCFNGQSAAILQPPTVYFASIPFCTGGALMDAQPSHPCFFIPLPFTSRTHTRWQTTSQGTKITPTMCAPFIVCTGPSK